MRPDHQAALCWRWGGAWPTVKCCECVCRVSRYGAARAVEGFLTLVRPRCLRRLTNPAHPGDEPGYTIHTAHTPPQLDTRNTAHPLMFAGSCQGPTALVTCGRRATQRITTRRGLNLRPQARMGDGSPMNEPNTAPANAPGARSSALELRQLHECTRPVRPGAYCLTMKPSYIQALSVAPPLTLVKGAVDGAEACSG